MHRKIMEDWLKQRINNKHFQKSRGIIVETDDGNVYKLYPGLKAVVLPGLCTEIIAEVKIITCMAPYKFIFAYFQGENEILRITTSANLKKITLIEEKDIKVL